MGAGIDASAPTTMDCTIIIRCYNEEKHIGNLLSGIQKQSIQPREIIVVDSGSTDATVDIVSRFPVTIVRIPKEHFSFGKALNMGCARATTSLLVFASAHVYPTHTDWLSLLLDPFRDERVGLVYGKQRGHPSTRFSEHRVFEQWFPDASSPYQKYPFCNNANAAIRRSLWERIPYAEHLTGLEDIDWAKRISDAGYAIAYQAEAGIIHIHNESYQGIFNRYYREALALKKIYPLERFGVRDFIMLLFSNIVSDGVRALKEHRGVRTLKEIVAFRAMQFFGTYRGFQEKVKEIQDLRERFYYPQRGNMLGKENKQEVREDRKIQYAQLWKK